MVPWRLLRRGRSSCHRHDPHGQQCRRPLVPLCGPFSIPHKIPIEVPLVKRFGRPTLRALRPSVRHAPLRQPRGRHGCGTVPVMTVCQAEDGATGRCLLSLLARPGRRRVEDRRCAEAGARPRPFGNFQTPEAHRGRCQGAVARGHAGLRRAVKSLSQNPMPPVCRGGLAPASVLGAARAAHPSWATPASGGPGPLDGLASVLAAAGGNR